MIRDRMGILIVGLVLALSPSSLAFTHNEAIGGVEVRAYAPDWIWQGQNLSILVVLDNETDSLLYRKVDLIMPEDAEDRFGFSGEKSLYVRLEPGATRRVAFANINTLSGLSPQHYTFKLVMYDPLVADESMFRIVEYPLTTVRGAMVSEGLWAAILPAGVAAAWCIVFALYLVRHAKRGAWKTPSASVFDDSRTSK